MLRTTSLTAVTAALALAATLSGCGTADAEPPLSETLPACEDVWVAGGSIPDDYAGCRDDEGVLKVSEIKDCTANDERLTTYGEQYFGLLGGKVQDDGIDSSAYNELYLACFGSDW